MTDKVQKIRKEVEKLKSQLIRGACSSQIAMETHCKEEAYNEVLAILDAVQEEPVSDDLGKVGSLKSLEYYPEKKTTNKTSKGVFDANMPRRKAYLRGFKDGAHAHKELIANKPVSEDLESVSKKYGKDTFVNECMYYGVCDDNDLADAFKAGAKWQKEQMMSKAIDALVHTFDNGYIRVGTQLLANNKYGLKVGDKVKLIIVREEQI